MAEITKVTTPMIPKENTSNRLKPVTDQAFDLTDPSKVHKADQEGKVGDRQSENNLLRDSMGRPAIAPLLKNTNEMMQVFKKIAMLVEMGVSASDAAKDVSTRELLESLFISQKDFGKTLMEQDKSSVLFKGEAFDVLRDINDNFGNMPKIRDAIANLLKTFDFNVNSENSVKTILYNCNNILDYMFSKDRAQFSNYLQDLANMLLPKEEAEAFSKFNQPANNSQATGQAQNPAQGQAAAQTQNTANPGALVQGEIPQRAGAQNPAQAGGQVENQNQQSGAQEPAQAQDAQLQQNRQPLPERTQENQANAQPAQQGQQPLPERAQENQANAQPAQQGQQSAVGAQQATQSPPLDQKAAAQILKNNLLPLLGEIVVKYHQNEKIRDVVMVVVHNIVRVDQGTPESLKDAIGKLIKELKQVANMPPGFEKQLLEAVKSDAVNVKNTPNTVISKLAEVVSETLSSPTANPAVARQAENMLISMLQNQSSLMDVLHFVLPLDTPQGQVLTEVYVDPETEEKVGNRKGKSHKVFLSVESEAHGSFELSFLETGEHVDFSMWCSNDLVKSLSGMKRQFSAIMQMHGYTMNSFSIDEMKAPHSVAEVFPRLLEKKVGIDVHI